MIQRHALCAREEDGRLTVLDSNKPAVNEGFPMKEWTVEIYVLDQDGKEKPARCFTKAVYHLHPSFANPMQSMRPSALITFRREWGS